VAGANYYRWGDSGDLADLKQGDNLPG